MKSLADPFVLREVMNIHQTAAYLGISEDTLYRYASTGLLPAFKLGNRWRFKRSLLDAWIRAGCAEKKRVTPR